MKGCPICGEKKFKDLDFGGYRYDGRDLPLAQCANCSLKYIRHDLTAAKIADFYNETSYFDAEYAGGVACDYFANREELQEKACAVLRMIKKIKPAGRLLEIGSAGGYFLETARDFFGYSVVGLEMSREMTEAARKRGLEVYSGDIDALPKTAEKFDVIYMGDVLEHIADPNTFTASLRERMNVGGILALELPLTFNLSLSGMFSGAVNLLRGRIGYKYLLPAHRRAHLEKKPPYHLLQFNGRSIKEYVRHNAFQMRYLKIYDGYPKSQFRSTPYYFIKALSYYLTNYLFSGGLGDRAVVIMQK